MRLYDICEKIAFVVDGIGEGTIEYTPDRLEMMMGQHPAEVLDSILSPVGMTVFLKTKKMLAMTACSNSWKA